MKNNPSFFLFLFWGSAMLLWMMVIFLFSSLPGVANPLPPTLLYYIERKGAHVFEYAVLMCLAVRFLSLYFVKENFQKGVYLAAALSLTYGVSDEIHQLFVPYRQARITDVLIDGAGIVFVVIMIFAWKKFSRHTEC